MEESLSDCSKILERLKEKRIGKDVLSDRPKVSVIIPAYNISSLVRETMNSVLAQTYKNFEVVIVNDGSNDTADLERKLEPYWDRIVYGKQENFGASLARNLAICLSRGSLIAFLDGDDIWLPNYLESQVRFLEENKLDMVYCDAELFGENYAAGETYMQTTPSNGAVTPKSLINASCSVITSGTVLKRRNLYEFGLFDSRSKQGQDFDLWFRLAKNGVKISYQRKVLLKYRVSSTSLSGTSVQRAERNVAVLEYINEKYQLNKSEKNVLKKQLEFSGAELDLEKGKFHLTQGEYDQAKRYIASANEYYRKPKLTLIIWLMKISPALALRLFRAIRPAEFSFITPKASHE